MIERDFVKQKKREFQVQEFISESLKNVGHSYTELQRTPLGDKVIIHTSRPGLIVGRKGQNISKLTEVLQTQFNLENPQVEISEVENPNLDANIVAERIASALERFGSNRFKGIMHKTMSDVLASGALGVEIKLSGKLPSSRAKAWRIYGGNLKKCGDAAVTHVRSCCTFAKLKSGVIGIQVNILPSGITMPDTIKMKEEPAVPVPTAPAVSVPASAVPSAEAPVAQEADAPVQAPVQAEKSAPAPAASGDTAVKAEKPQRKRKAPPAKKDKDKDQEKDSNKEAAQ